MKNIFTAIMLISCMLLSGCGNDTYAANSKMVSINENTSEYVEDLSDVFNEPAIAAILGYAAYREEVYGDDFELVFDNNFVKRRSYYYVRGVKNEIWKPFNPISVRQAVKFTLKCIQSDLTKEDMEGILPYAEAYYREIKK